MTRSNAHRVLLLTLGACALLCSALAGSASAATDLGVGSELPAIGFDAGSGTTYVAWEANDDSSIQLCVLPAGLAGCSGGTITLTDATLGSPGVIYTSPQVSIEPGGAAVVSANVDGEKSGLPAGYPGLGGTVAWSSAPPGSAFTSGEHGLDNGGIILAPDGGDAPESGAVALDASPLELGVFGDNVAGSGFSAFELSKSAPAAQVQPDKSEKFGSDLFADSGRVAALLNTPAAGEDLVVAVSGGLFNEFSECPLSARHSGFAAAHGTLANLNKQSPTWTGSFKALDCHAQGPVLAGGPAGIGVLEDEGTGIEGSGADGMDYRAFDATTMQFGAPVEIADETSASLLGADELSLSQDSTGGVYAMWSDERGTEMSYSNTGGASWAAPVTVPGTLLNDPVIAGVGGGTFEVAYNSAFGGGTHQFVEAFNYAALFAAEHAPPPPVNPVFVPKPLISPPPPPKTIATSASFEGGTVGLSVPNQCIKGGNIVGTLTYRVSSHKRKGRVVVKIYKVLFKVGGTSKTVVRKKLSNKPFVAKLKIKHPKAGARYVLTARAFIKVKHGPPRSKTLKVTLTACA
jgi:hypothetical protein